MWATFSNLKVIYSTLELIIYQKHNVRVKYFAKQPPSNSNNTTFRKTRIDFF